MAQDYLVVPGMMVDMEWLFSKAGDMVMQKQQRLMGEMIQVMQLVKNWDKTGVLDLVSYWEERAVTK